MTNIYENSLTDDLDMDCLENTSATPEQDVSETESASDHTDNLSSETTLLFEEEANADKTQEQKDSEVNDTTDQQIPVKPKEAIIPQNDTVNNEVPEEELGVVGTIVKLRRERETEPVEKPENSVNQGVKINETGTVSEEIKRNNAKQLSPEEQLSKAMRELGNHRRRKDILWGIVYGVDSFAGHLRVSAIWNGVSISFSKDSYFEPEFRFGDDYDELSDSEKLNREMVLARYQEGAQIPFIVTDIRRAQITSGDRAGETVTVVAGSKRAAMESLRKFYFIDQRVKVNINDVAPAHVLSVRDDWALVECLGCEYRLDAYSLNDQNVDSCMDWVKPGDTIDVRIKKIHVNDDNTVRIVVSGRLFITPPTIAFMQVNGSYYGVVDSFNKKRKTYTVILMNGVLAAVPATDVMYGYPLTIGDRVNVKVRRITDTHVIGSALKL